MTLLQRFRALPLWARVLAGTALLSVGVAGTSALGSKPNEQAGRITGTTATTATSTTAGTGERERASTSTTAGDAETPDLTVTTSAKPTTSTVKPATTTTTKHAAGGDPTAVLAGLRVAPEGARTGYSRDLFKLWVDADHNGCDTREEVLISESRSKAQVDPYGCKVVAGDWYSLYDGLTFTDPAELDVDHMVPLAEAWDSGAAGWDAAKRQAYANDLEHPQALRAVSASANRSKGDLDPGQWKPTRDGAWCEYANDWVVVKKAWDLTADQNEVDDLKVMLRTCSGQTQSTTATTARPTTTKTAGGTVAITAVDCQGEAVTVRNGGSAPADLTGWSMHDEGAPHTYHFPAGYTLAPGASVTIRSGGAAGPGELAWTNQNVWNNDGDMAYLVNAGGAVVSTRSC